MVKKRMIDAFEGTGDYIMTASADVLALKFNTTADVVRNIANYKTKKTRCGDYFFRWADKKEDALLRKLMNVK